jgi:hypothetical protein
MQAGSAASSGEPQSPLSAGKLLIERAVPLSHFSSAEIILGVLHTNFRIDGGNIFQGQHSLGHVFD